jgi:hypothetical protein
MKCPLPADIAERIDKLLGSLESQQKICGNGTMLSLGSSIVSSRFPVKETLVVANMFDF